MSQKRNIPLWVRVDGSQCGINCPFLERHLHEIPPARCLLFGKDLNSVREWDELVGYKRVQACEGLEE